MRDLAKEIAKRESGKEEVSIAQISEILRHLTDILFEDKTVIKTLVQNGKRRNKNNPFLKKKKYQRRTNRQLNHLKREVSK